jgi:hypothetical protein
MKPLLVAEGRPAFVLYECVVANVDDGNADDAPEPNRKELQPPMQMLWYRF